MEIYSYNKPQFTPSFGKFIKIKGHPHQIDNFRSKLSSKNLDVFQLSVNKGPHKKVLYLFSGKDSDRFIDLLDKMYFAKFRWNVEKYFPKKPKKMNIASARKKLDKGYFNA